MISLDVIYCSINIKSNHTWLSCCACYTSQSFTALPATGPPLQLLHLIAICPFFESPKFSDRQIHPKHRFTLRILLPLQWGNGIWVKDKSSISWTIEPNRHNPSLPTTSLPLRLTLNTLTLPTPDITPRQQQRESLPAATACIS